MAGLYTKPPAKSRPLRRSAIKQGASFAPSTCKLPGSGVGLGMSKLLASTVLVLGLIFALPLKICAQTEIKLADDHFAAFIDPATLEIKLQPAGHATAVLSLAQTNLGAPANSKSDARQASWTFPDRHLSVSVHLAADGLAVDFLATAPGEFSFPVLPAGASAQAWILPFFEGLYLPCHDVTWQNYLTTREGLNTTADLSLPFLGLDYGDFTLCCLLANPFNNALRFENIPGSNFVQARLTHEFTRNQTAKEFEVLFEIGTNSPVEPARIYRRWLQQRGEFVSLSEKIARTPEARKLPGAAHIYLWGDDLLDRTDVTDWKSLVRQLQSADGEASNSPARSISSALGPAARDSVAELARAEWLDQYHESVVIEDLNRLLTERDFSRSHGGQPQRLDSATRALLEADKTAWSTGEVCRLNSLLLCSAFSNTFAPPASWGNGVSPKMIGQLAAAGLDRLWLGTASWDGLVNRPETVAAARQAGYLIGPYDSYHSIHSPKQKDTWETAQFDQALFDTGGIVMANGVLKHGFKHRGYLLSPNAARPYVEKRVSGLMRQFSANSWFMDCDGFGDYFDDYSDVHPATQSSDLQARLGRMSWIRDRFGAVIGTEGCFAGVAATVHFAHGVLTPVIGWGDPDMANSKSPFFVGRYYPPDGPQVFFRPVPLKEEYRRVYYDPKIRLPLFETVFHDSVVATHHWSFPSFKNRDDAAMVELLELLYQVPPLYHLNLAEFRLRREAIKRHYDFFSPLHRQTALLPLTDFRWLTPDHTVQATWFGSQFEMIANFGAIPFSQGTTNVPPGTVAVLSLANHKLEIYPSQGK